MRRPQLAERLIQGVMGPLTLVSAPAGFGKTTLLAPWLAESGMPVAWLSLEPGDNEPLPVYAVVPDPADPTMAGDFGHDWLLVPHGRQHR